jgi:hypothetical protein
MSASQDASVEYGQLKINIYDFFPLGAFDCFLTTPPIHFLSRFLPRLDKIKWCQPDEYMVDEVDEYLNDQYEQDLKDFYIEERENARAIRIEKNDY